MPSHKIRTDLVFQNLSQPLQTPKISTVSNYGLHGYYEIDLMLKFVYESD